MSEKREIYLEKAPAREMLFLAFTRDHDLTAARETFRARYGVEPDQVLYSKRLYYLGPCPRQKVLVES